MARVLLARNELDRAAESLALCVTNPYTARPALLVLSQIRQRQGDAASAAGLARRAAAMPRPFDWPDPWLREVQFRRADRQKLQDQANGLLMQQRVKEAEAAIDKLLKAFPDDPEGWLLRGRLHFLERRCAEAEEAFRRYLSLQPVSINGLVLLQSADERLATVPDLELKPAERLLVSGPSLYKAVLSRAFSLLTFSRTFEDRVPAGDFL